ncbi:MAG: HlyC/CorC family transporter [Lachnospiraceae bacterium]|nr:HlyC/CorC family transporter [Lachnospiraceae bacterium]
MDTATIIQGIILIVLLGLSAFFSSAETSLTTINPIKVRTLIEKGNKRALKLQKVTEQHGKMLSTILIGNNIVNISASSLATTMAISIWGNYAVGIATGILTLLVLLFGEILPKNMAMVKTESLALFYAPIVYGLMWLLTPVIFLVDRIAGFFMKLMHIDPDKKNLMTETELRTYVDVSHEDGVIESEEKEIINNLFDFSDSVAKDIMIPRIDMVTIEENAGYDELMAVFRECMYTRIPVYKDDRDNIIGLVNIKDFILVNDVETFRVADIIRDAYYTYEFKKTADLLMEMKETTNNVAFVLSEYGACAGMITLEDLLEEIVGEIRDEYDEDEDEFIKKVGKDAYLIDGNRKLDDINDELDTKLESEDYDSIAGLVLQILDRMPTVGEEVTTPDGIRIKVETVHQNRITKVLLRLPEESTEVLEQNKEV